MGWIKEFKDFVMRGNVLDLAVAVIIGGAFGKIVGSLVNDIIMPIIGRITGGLDFNDHRAIWDRLDKALAKHPGMVLLHGGSPKGAEKIGSMQEAFRMSCVEQAIVPQQGEKLLQDLVLSWLIKVNHDIAAEQGVDGRRDRPAGIEKIDPDETDQAL